jgi:DNA-binding PadR family transcriptional regulator
LIRPSLLLLMHEGPAHGYDLLDRLREFGVSEIDPSIIYRILREMEDDGLITSVWEEKETQGPPRRVYSLTQSGNEALHSYLVDLKLTRERIDHLVQQYEQHISKKDGDFHG